MGPYNASKHAVVAVSETLFSELALAQSPVGVSVLCPSWVRTRISNRPATGREGSGDPEAAAAISALVEDFISSGKEPAEVGRGRPRGGEGPPLLDPHPRGHRGGGRGPGPFDPRRRRIPAPPHALSPLLRRCQTCWPRGAFRALWHPKPPQERGGESRSGEELSHPVRRVGAWDCATCCCRPRCAPWAASWAAPPCRGCASAPAPGTPGRPARRPRLAGRPRPLRRRRPPLVTAVEVPQREGVHRGSGAGRGDARRRGARGRCRDLGSLPPPLGPAGGDSTSPSSSPGRWPGASARRRDPHPTAAPAPTRPAGRRSSASRPPRLRPSRRGAPRGCSWSTTCARSRVPPSPPARMPCVAGGAASVHGLVLARTPTGGVTRR